MNKFSKGFLLTLMATAVVTGCNDDKEVQVEEQRGINLVLYGYYCHSA